jgi:LysM repeat protein
MKYFFGILIIVLMFTGTVFSQETITHKVERGETINEIAKKYKVTPFDIYQLNPDAQSRLKPRSVLLIPSKSGYTVPNANVKTHEVIAKETLYGIEKKYNVSDEDLKKANPFIEKDGLQIGQILTIPAKNNSKINEPLKDKIVYHDVLAKETKYSIAKKYGITIEELEKRNPEVVKNLPIGYRLIIKGKASVNAAEIASQKVTGNKNLSGISQEEVYEKYEVKPKETLYSLSKMFDLSQEELISLNPELKNGVAIGMFLKVPAKKSLLSQGKKEYASMASDINLGDRKKMVLLLPFNLSKIESDTVNSVSMRLKKDKFLNMTLDFYAGALMAIDSAKTLGLPVDVAIYDSQETKYSSDVASIIKNNNLQAVNAVVGPFYQNNAETTARLLNMYNIPVISPLSKDMGNPITNLYQAIPMNEVLKNTMFDYMRSKNGNILAVVDRKKESVIQYIKQNQEGVKFVSFNENGGVSEESLKGMLVQGKVNYVVMETANTWMIKTTIAAMISSMPAYQVQLVILEPNDTLDSDEINFTNLTRLNLMYPSVTRDNISPESVVFEKEFRKVNTIAPSDFATRGFDVTFDTMMRLVQNKSFEETVNSTATQQLENKFEYYKKEGGGYVNKGVYVMYYDTDLTIKQAN